MAVISPLLVVATAASLEKLPVKEMRPQRAVEMLFDMPPDGFGLPSRHCRQPLAALFRREAEAVAATTLAELTGTPAAAIRDFLAEEGLRSGLRAYGVGEAAFVVALRLQLIGLVAEAHAAGHIGERQADHLIRVVEEEPPPEPFGADRRPLGRPIAKLALRTGKSLFVEVAGALAGRPPEAVRDHLKALGAEATLDELGIERADFQAALHPRLAAALAEAYAKAAIEPAEAARLLLWIGWQPRLEAKSAEARGPDPPYSSTRPPR